MFPRLEPLADDTTDEPSHFTGMRTYRASSACSFLASVELSSGLAPYVEDTTPRKWGSVLSVALLRLISTVTTVLLWSLRTSARKDTPSAPRRNARRVTLFTHRRRPS